jgi:hypothetical protein
MHLKELTNPKTIVKVIKNKNKSEQDRKNFALLMGAVGSVANAPETRSETKDQKTIDHAVYLQDLLTGKQKNKMTKKNVLQMVEIVKSFINPSRQTQNQK